MGGRGSRRAERTTEDSGSAGASPSRDLANGWLPMPVHIAQIEYHLPAKVVTNEQLAAENPSWELGNVEQRSGVLTRHVAAENETALDLAVEACRKLLAARGGGDDDVAKQIDALIFCTQSQDYIMPANSSLLHARLELPANVFAVDINSACAGFVHGLALANALVLGGQAHNVVLVNADTYSKFIHPKDRSTRVLFGDGAAATWLTRDETKGIRDIVCATWGKLHDKFIIPAGGCRLPRSAETAKPIERDKGAVTTQEHINMDGMGILQFVTGRVPQQVREILERNKLKPDDIDVFLFHQASRVALDSLTRALRLDPKKVFSNLPRIGNLVSASLPVAMRDAISEGVIKPGSKVLACGFGVGLTWASAIIDF